MVVCLILEHEEPVLILPIHIDSHADAARIDLLGFVEILELALRAQRFHADDGDVHQGHIPLVALVECPAVIRIALIGLDNRQGEGPVLDVHGVNRRGKRRVAAVIRPVGVDHAQLRDRRRTVLRIAEILLNEFEIRLTHRKAVLFVKTLELTAREPGELREDLHVRRQHNPTLERRRRCKRGLAALYFIDQIGFDLLIDTIIELSDQYDHACRTHIGALPLRYELHALRRSCCRRIKLPRQGFDCEHVRIGKERQCILIDRIHRRIGEDDIPHLCELLRAQSLYVITRDDAHGAQFCQSECLHQIVTEALCGYVEIPLPLLHKDSFDSHRHPPS